VTKVHLADSENGPHGLAKTIKKNLPFPGSTPLLPDYVFPAKKKLIFQQFGRNADGHEGVNVIYSSSAAVLKTYM